ncbi:MAG: hypothetical protein DHS20C01_14920 [marine bacterium B5-7]|nr:MAG: hypothetical protein DHS20C01_14920 [marine bacterium B5-7]
MVSYSSSGNGTSKSNDRQLDGPLYSLERLIAVANNKKAYIVNDRAIQDIENLGWDNSDVCRLVCHLEDKHYHGSERCQTSNQMSVDCDAYVIERIETTEFGNSICARYYLKLALTKSGNLLLIVSCHLS